MKTLREHNDFGDEAMRKDCEVETEFIWVPRASSDPLSGKDRLERLDLFVADEPYQIFKNDKRSWISESVRKAYPDHFAWASVGDEYIIEKEGKVLSDYETETSVAMFIFLNTHGSNGKAEDRFINDASYGWSDYDDTGLTFITDLHTLTETTLATIQNFVFEAGLHFDISGVSSLHPSLTTRLRIWKKD
jgi:hypothetical protein